ncbi:MAG: 30S ribosomal protein S19e [Candidatus Aenigmatarchaeota archaeon]
MSIFEVDPQKLIERLKEELKKFPEIKVPHWAKFAKNSAGNERPPEQKDFWYIRAASILRRLYIDGPIGVSRLRTYYGRRKRRGRRPSKTYKASGKIIRTILQQLEKVGLVQTVKGGRALTPKGRSLLDKLANELKKSS